MVSGWKAETPLEQEIFNLLHKNKQPVTDPLLTPVEKASPQSYEPGRGKDAPSRASKGPGPAVYYEARARREEENQKQKVSTQNSEERERPSKP